MLVSGEKTVGASTVVEGDKQCGVAGRFKEPCPLRIGFDLLLKPVKTELGVFEHVSTRRKHRETDSPLTYRSQSFVLPSVLRHGFLSCNCQ